MTLVPSSYPASGQKQPGGSVAFMGKCGRSKGVRPRCWQSPALLQQVLLKGKLRSAPVWLPWQALFACTRCTRLCARPGGYRHLRNVVPIPTELMIKVGRPNIHTWTSKCALTSGKGSNKRREMDSLRLPGTMWAGGSKRGRWRNAWDVPIRHYGRCKCWVFCVISAFPTPTGSLHPLGIHWVPTKY